MKLTATQLRRIIKEEVSKVTTRRDRLSEGHTRITEEEFAQWKSGNWGFVAEDHHGVSLAKDDDSSRFLHGSDEGHPMDDEGYMVKSRMSSMKKMAADICGLLDSDDQLPGWVQDLVATSHNDLQHVHDYLMGDEEMRVYEKAPHQVSTVGESRRRRSSHLAEGHSRITSEEVIAWKNGNWGFISENSDETRYCVYCGWKGGDSSTKACPDCGEHKLVTRDELSSEDMDDYEFDK
jgi:predicted RNA-binding Zn-ribbon protein involved in translation (DUF1610 family)